MQTKECPSCAMEVDVKSKICPVCAYEFRGLGLGVKLIAAILALLLLYLLFF